MTKRLFLKAWFLLFYADWLMRFRGFLRVHALVREEPVSPSTDPRVDLQQLSHAVDLGCVFYFKQVLCLQRSAALAILLRRHGWKGEMVIGAQLLPFLSHAWVEVCDRVVNDKPYIRNAFQVLDRC